MSDEDTQDLTPTDLDPPAENLGANAIHVISLVFGGLIRLDANLNVAPDGASSWNVSRAFSLAINREVLANKFLSGQYVPAHTILPPGLPGYEGNIKGRRSFRHRQMRSWPRRSTQTAKVFLESPSASAAATPVRPHRHRCCSGDGKRMWA
jgi:hypothetical protein